MEAARECCSEDALLARLTCSDQGHVTGAVEELQMGVQEDRAGLACTILDHPDSEGLISALCHLLTSTDSRLCSNVAYLVGVLAESEAGVRGLLAAGGAGLLGALQKLLRDHDPETAANSAGAIATLAESSAGRQCVLGSEVFRELVSGVCGLLDLVSEEAELSYEEGVSNAALVLARLSLCPAGCQQLLAHPEAALALHQLNRCLTHGSTDCGVNAAFALGRLCDSEEGRRHILSLEPQLDLVEALQSLISRGDPGGGKSACFALGCLATGENGHTHILHSPALPCLLASLRRLLQGEEQDCAWFSAMVVRVLVSRPSGVLRVREDRELEQQLQTLSCSDSTPEEVLEEVSACLRKLQRLPKPLPPHMQHLDNGSALVTWDRSQPESGLEVTNSLLCGERLLYRGGGCSFTLSLSDLHNPCGPAPPLSLRLVQSTAGGDVSPCSAATLLALDRERLEPELEPPGPPLALRVLSCSATWVRLCWAPPSQGAAPRAYQLLRGGVVLECTSQLSTVVGGLSPGTEYEFVVRGLGTGVQVGEGASVRGRTADPLTHAPSRLTVTVLGRRELQVSWGVPALPLGKLFNYQLSINGSVAYLGTGHTHHARRLRPNTQYTCTVTAITSGGRCESLPVTKRTARDEYQHTHRSLYSPTRQTSPATPPPPLPLPPFPPNREITEVKRSGPQPGQKPRAQLSLSGAPDRQADGGRDRCRTPLVQTHGSESRQSSSPYTEVCVGTASGFDVSSAWHRARMSWGGGPGKSTAPPGSAPLSLPPPLLLPHRAKTESQLLTRQQPWLAPRASGLTWSREVSLCAPPLAPPADSSWDPTELPNALRPGGHASTGVFVRLNCEVGGRFLGTGRWREGLPNINHSVR
ncbi:uncharacterized protein LOC136758712 isoform X2 [Amia ocellicauda]|uniref:uncharacterized protein LOC136758712 isoform X2 n=1 Tax=Amia ocellicauda TaxID=2972642 RepID=UPI003463B337